MQLSQALGSGRLQGDEFKTIAETAPIILDVVAEYMGKSREEVKKLASEGKITSKLLFEAINNSTQKINQQFEQMPLTFGQAMQQMENAALKFVGDINQFTNATNGLAQGIHFLAENFSVLATIVGGLMLAHLAKYGQSMAANIVTSYKQNLANLQLAQSAQVKAKSELGAAQANMTVLASELRLAQSEQTRSILRDRMAQQATLITSLKNAETVATNNLAAAQTRASIAGRALSGVMGLLGGPLGLLVIAISAAVFAFDTFISDMEIGANTLGATWGDALIGVWNDFKDVVDKTINWFSEQWSNATTSVSDNFDSLLGVAASSFLLIHKGAKSLINSFIGLFVGGFKAIMVVWDNFPASMEDLVAIAFNSLVRIAEAGINKLIEFIKASIEILNAAAAMLGKDNLIDTSAWKVDLNGFELKGSAEAKKTAQAISDAFSEGFNFDYIGSAADSVMAYLEEVAVRTKKARLADESKNASLNGGSNTEKEIPVGVELKQDKKVIRTVTDPNVSKIRVTLGVRGLYKQYDDGSTNDAFAYIITQIGTDVRTVEFAGKTQEQYLQQIELDNLPPAPFNITVWRSNADSTTMREQNATFWASYTEITRSGLRYPHTALFGIKLNSKTFSNFPRINVLMREVFMQPLKKEDIGKPFQDLMLGRIYTYMKEQNIIQA